LIICEEKIAGDFQVRIKNRHYLHKIILPAFPPPAAVMRQNRRHTAIFGSAFAAFSPSLRFVGKCAIVSL